jgi:hypothetical protein
LFNYCEHLRLRVGEFGRSADSADKRACPNFVARVALPYADG